MNPRKTLISLEKTARAHCVRYKYLVANNINGSLPDWNIECGNITINLLNTWSQFIRSYYLGCVFGSTSQKDGQITTSQEVYTVNDAIGNAIAYHTPHKTPNAEGIWHRRDEPPWHDPNIFLRLATHYQFSNLTTVQASLSMQATVFHDLPVFRNFFAHRNQSTRDASEAIASRYGIHNIRMPSEILRKYAIRRPQSLIEDWIDEIDLTIEFLCY